MIFNLIIETNHKDILNQSEIFQFLLEENILQRKIVMV